MSKKRALDSFFTPVSQKKARSNAPPPDSAESTAIAPSGTDQPMSSHPSYPFPIPHLPPHITSTLSSSPSSTGRAITNAPDLDLLYFQPFIPPTTERGLFTFLRKELFFYRVKYKINRGGLETEINTPRYTTVFGVDETSKFSSSPTTSTSPTTISTPTTTTPTTTTSTAKESIILIDAHTSKPVPQDRYACTPRPLPHCLDALRAITEIFTDSTYNFCLVNYYASGSDSISYHSDDERFLGPLPSIASFSLGASRDFLLKHKPVPPPPSTRPFNDNKNTKAISEKPIKLPLASGDMVLMRGSTQANWLHSIPKRSGKGGVEGRINITFRKAMVRGGTENYYRYNVGEGGVWRWDGEAGEMREWNG